MLAKLMSNCYTIIVVLKRAIFLPTHSGGLRSHGLSKEASRCRIEEAFDVDRYHIAIRPVLPALVSLRRRIFGKGRGCSHTLGRRFPQPQVCGDARKASDDSERGPMLWRRTSVVSGERLSRSHRRPMDGK